MNTQQACGLLGIDVGASQEDVSKAFRKCAAELHPDRNKEPDAELRFKQVNEAYQFLQKNGTHPRVNFGGPKFRRVQVPFSDMFGSDEEFTINFDNGRVRVESHGPQVKGSVTITFAESILGCQKQVDIMRNGTCPTCNGLGKNLAATEEDCEYCEGKGTRKYGENTRDMKCTFCDGGGRMKKTLKCETCFGSGKADAEVTIGLAIPPGIANGQRVRLRGEGDRINNMIHDALIDVHVIPDKDLMRNGVDVIGFIELSLLEALKGTKKIVKTVKGDKTLKIRPGVKNKDTIRLQGFGVPPIGSQLFEVRVEYPQDTSKLIEVLEEEASQQPEPEEIEGE